MRSKVPQQPPKERIKNFFEVALGFFKVQAEEETNRCLQCKDPVCVRGCPVEIDIPAFIKLIKEGMRKEALEKIKEKNNLPGICGRVCPQEDQCEAACVLNKKIPINPIRNTKAIIGESKISNGVNIGALERYASDYELKQRAKSKGQRARNFLAKVAVVGSGPAGLTCAADLAKMGYAVTLFESLHLPGGVLMYGIPEFRLPKKIVQSEVDYIKSLGVDIKTDTLIGNTYDPEDLFEEGFRAIFIATGAGLPQFLGIAGENLNRVYSANEFLTRVNLMQAYKFPEYATPVNLGKKLAVVGAGNVAFDCARVALRLGPSLGPFFKGMRRPILSGLKDEKAYPLGLGKEVVLVYRRSENEMPARREEIENAKEEGIIFKVLTQPVRIIDDGKGFVGGLECMAMELDEQDASGRRRPVPIKGSNFVLRCDTVIVAIGQGPNPLLPKVTPGLKTNKDGTIWVDKNFMTSIPGVFAGGDIITGAGTVISAMGAGKKAAVAIDKYIKNSKSQIPNHKQIPIPNDRNPKPKEKR